MLAAGCVTARDRGDHAYRANNFQEALDQYDRAIAAGDQDPELFVSAARAALKIGDLALAERHYSSALRYGAGEDVARELADLYISTSNYTKAVRVLQGILEITDQPQAVFNDLGAALMYAGSPLNAESYLLVAQQMDPMDPVPYVNLGVLYEKHLRNPRLAYGFYQCFLELDAQSRQRGKVDARVAYLKMHYADNFPPAYAVECGRPYQPAMLEEPAALREPVRTEDQPQELDETPEEDAAPGASAQPAENPTEKPAPIEIVRGSADERPAATVSRDEYLLAMAEKAFADRNYLEAVRLVESSSVRALDAGAWGIYGRSLLALERFDEAQRWLKPAVDAAPTPETAEALWHAYQRQQMGPQAAALCKQFQDDARYATLRQKCAEGSGAPKPQKTPSTPTP